MQSVESILIDNIMEDYTYWLGEAFPKEPSTLGIELKELLKKILKLNC